MRSKSAIILAAVMLVGLLGCGADVSDSAEYLKDIDPDKHVTLGEYKSIEINLAPPAVTDEDIDNAISAIMQNFPLMESVEGPAEVGDYINIDFVGFIDGEAFPGGSAEGFDYMLGSYQVIPDLDEGMTGMSVGDVRDVPVTFPEVYHNNPELAGQPAVFTVTMNSIERALDDFALTDDYIDWLTEGEYTNIADFRALMSETLWQEAESIYENMLIVQLTEIVLGNAEFKSIPAGIIDRLSNALTETLSYYAMMSGLDVLTYMSLSGIITDDATPETIIKEEAEKTAQHFIAFQAIANNEGLNVTNDEVDAEIALMAEAAGINVIEYRAQMDIEGVREYLMLENVNNFLVDNAVLTE